MSPVLIGFIVYLVVVLVAGLATFRLNKSQEDFLLAGRRLNVWVATFSERASGESAWLLLGLPAVVMVVGLVEIWAAIGCVAGIAFAWWMIAAPLRRETERYDALTLPEYLSRKFEGHAKAIRATATLIVIFFYAFYVAAQFSGAGKVLNQTLQIDTTTGIVIGAVVIVLYTMMGGFFAVAWTDLIQAIVMIGTLVVLPIVGLYALSAKGTTLGAGLADIPELGSVVGGKSGLAALSAVVAGLSWGFGYTGQPHTLARFMSVKSPDEIKRGRIIAMSWAIPAFAGAVMIGLVGIGLYDILDFRDTERLMPRMAIDLLPGWLAGIFISGAIAAMMSTADSQLLVATSAVAEDLVRRSFGVELSEKKLVLLSRVTTFALGRRRVRPRAEQQEADLPSRGLCVGRARVLLRSGAPPHALLEADPQPRCALRHVDRRVDDDPLLGGEGAQHHAEHGLVRRRTARDLRVVPPQPEGQDPLARVAGAHRARAVPHLEDPHPRHRAALRPDDVLRAGVDRGGRRQLPRGQLIREPDRERDDRQRRVCIARGAEQTAAGDEEVRELVHLPGRVDDPFARARAHPGRAQVMKAAVDRLGGPGRIRLAQEEPADASSAGGLREELQGHLERPAIEVG